MELINGNIPANTQCPYYKECGHSCKLKDGNTIDVPFSCGLARFIKMCKEIERKKVRT